MKQDFPIFRNNPDLIFFDSTSSSQKPQIVIDGIKEYLENDYSNIHRGMYDIAIRSEDLYKRSKETVCDILGGRSYKEVIYTLNSTYALNILAQSLKKNNKLKPGDKVLLTIVEHHANVVPWLILKKEIGIDLEFVNVDKNYDIDLEDFKSKYDETVKVISFTHVSNVVGQIHNLEEIGRLKRQDTFFIVDGSQSVPHMKVDIKKLNCDFLFFTGHKVFADSGIGVLWGKEELLSILDPIFSGGGAIGEVHCQGFTHGGLPDKFEPGTPNMTGAVSLLKAFEYIESIGGYSVIEEHERMLIEYFLEKSKELSSMQILGSTNLENRVSVFSFVIDGVHSHDVAEILAENGIAVRSGKHCAHPFFKQLGYANSVRASLYIYNTTEEIDTFFNILKKLNI